MRQREGTEGSASWACSEPPAEGPLMHWQLPGDLHKGQNTVGYILQGPKQQTNSSETVKLVLKEDFSLGT